MRISLRAHSSVIAPHTGGAMLVVYLLLNSWPTIISVLTTFSSAPGFNSLTVCISPKITKFVFLIRVYPLVTMWRPVGSYVFLLLLLMPFSMGGPKDDKEKDTDKDKGKEKPKKRDNREKKSPPRAVIDFTGTRSMSEWEALPYNVLIKSCEDALIDPIGPHSHLAQRLYGHYQSLASERASRAHPYRRNPTASATGSGVSTHTQSSAVGNNEDIFEDSLHDIMQQTATLEQRLHLLNDQAGGQITDSPSSFRRDGLGSVASTNMLAGSGGLLPSREDEGE